MNESRLAGCEGLLVRAVGEVNDQAPGLIVKEY